MDTKTATVIGGGPAGLMAAEVLARAGVATTVYDAMPSPGRKFLLAGRGGLNLTHSEELGHFLTRYGVIDPLLKGAIERFPPAALRAWAEGLGQEMFVGSSGRVFPRAMKASPLLRAWLGRLGELGVRVALRHRWLGWDDDGRLRFARGGREETVAADVTVLALGGASWPRLGSDGAWAGLLAERGVAIAPLAPSNCGFTAAWSEAMRRVEGAPLKRIALRFGEHGTRGEAVVTRDKQSLSNVLRKALKLPPVAAALLHEATTATGRPLASLPAGELAALIKAAPVRLIGVQPIANAISTAGGIRFAALDRRFMLTALPGVFAAGEMLDWEAPTGGYLLQACFATGITAAEGALDWLQRARASNPSS